MIFFVIKEAFKSINRTKFSFFLSLISTAIGVFLILLSLMSIDSSNQVENKIKNRIELTTFLDDTVSNYSKQNIQNSLKEKKYISKISFISKDEAADIFIRETGEDFREILDYNPLPASFIISLRPIELTKGKLDSLVNEISSIEGIESVEFQADIFLKVLGFVKEFQKYLFGLSALLIIIAFYLVFSTMKLIVINRTDEIETMKLVGGTLSIIKLPVIINGFIIGIIASLISFALIYFGFSFLQNYFSEISFYKINWIYYLALSLIIGIVIGFVCSYLSVKNISLKIIK
ncbi:MAG: permease-like cell division protein FtsX [Ignavibacterium sp.]